MRVHLQMSLHHSIVSKTWSSLRSYLFFIYDHKIRYPSLTQKMMLILQWRASWKKLSESVAKKTSQWKCIRQKICWPENDIWLQETSFKWNWKEFLKISMSTWKVPSISISTNEDQASLAFTKNLASFVENYVPVMAKKTFSENTDNILVLLLSSCKNFCT